VVARRAWALRDQGAGLSDPAGRRECCAMPRTRGSNMFARFRRYLCGRPIHGLPLRRSAQPGFQSLLRQDWFQACMPVLVLPEGLWANLNMAAAWACAAWACVAWA